MHDEDTLTFDTIENPTRLFDDLTVSAHRPQLWGDRTTIRKLRQLLDVVEDLPDKVPGCVWIV